MSPRAARGLSLIELMIAMAISVVMSLALGSFMLQGTRNSREDINIASMLDELGYAASVLTEDLEMAGFLAAVHDPSAVVLDGTLALSGSDCGAAGWYSTLQAVAVLDNNTGTTAGAHAATNYPCLTAADVVPGTDIIAVKRVLGRVAGTDTSTSAMVTGTIYLRTHDKSGLLYLQGGTPGAMATPFQNWEYAPAVYFVQRWSTSATESPQIPSLCRMVLKPSGGTPAFTRECVARGVENLQVEIGVDSDEDGAANYFTPTPTDADLNRASTARLYLQVRSTRPDYNYVNQKTYQIGNTAAPYTPSGVDTHYYRKTLSTEVALRNPRALQGVAVQ